ncbi:MAG: SDR family oxidoreductase [Lentimicrobium sp.]|nr:SDR family oxidoreductase [Lentimicrobium sp.]
MKGKVVIITGGSSGIGLAMAHEFGRLGAFVAISARNGERLQLALTELKDKGIEAMAVKADVSLESDCRNLIEKVVEAKGKIDILVNNAGVSMRAAFKNTDLSVIKTLMDINFWGTVYCTKFALPYLLESKGSVAGIISVAGYIGLPGRTGYSASKFAIRGFLETLRCENLKTGLHVLVAAPGFTSSNIRKSALLADGSLQGDTPRNEGKMMSSEKAAAKIVRAIAKRKNKLVLTFLEGKFAVTLNHYFPRVVNYLVYNQMSKEPDSPFH